MTSPAVRHLAALAGLAALAALGCAGPGQPTPPPPPATAGLIVLAGDPGDATLTAWDQRGTARPIGLPDAGTAWISAGPGGRLAATLDDGTVHVTDLPGDRTGTHAPGSRAGDDEPDWRRAIAADAELPEEPLRFATWSPGGAHLAALAADFGASAGLTLVVIDPVVGATLLLPLPSEPVVAPLAWLADDRVLAQTNRGPLVVDIGTGDVGAGPPLDAPGGTPLAATPDSFVAIGDPGGGSVEIRPLGPWLAGDRGDPQARVTSEAELGAIAFAPGSERLAVVWQQIDRPGSIAIYLRAEGWAETSRLTLPRESARAAVDWLR